VLGDWLKDRLIVNPSARNARFVYRNHILVFQTVRRQGADLLGAPLRAV